MEHSRPPSPSENFRSEKPRWKRGVEAVSRKFQELIKPPEWVASVESGDREKIEKRKKKYGRFRRIFGKAFKSEAEIEPIPEPQEPKPRNLSFPFERFADIPSPVPVKEGLKPPLDRVDDPVASSVEMGVAPPVEGTEKAANNVDETPAPSEPFVSPGEAGQPPVETVEEEEPRFDVDTSTFPDREETEGDPPERTTPDIDSSSDEESGGGAVPELRSSITSTSSEKPSPTVERVIERRNGGAALAALVAAEVLSRSRDKKIREEAKGLERQVKDLKEKQKETEQAQMLHETRNSRDFERVHKQVRPTTPEKTAPTPQIASYKSPERAPAFSPQPERPAFYPRPEKLTPPTPLLSRERVVETGPPRLEKLPEPSFTPERPAISAQELIKPHLQEKQSELLLQQVEAAAERNVALENQYELRHEAKDVATSRSAGQGVTGDTTGSSGQYHSSLSSTLDGSAAKYSAIDPKRAKDDVYKKAVMSGLWGAAILLVCIGLVLFFLHS